MPITLAPEVETKLRAQAESAGLTIRPTWSGSLCDEQTAEEELEALALEGLNSGDPFEPGPGYWEGKHRRLDERLRNITPR